MTKFGQSLEFSGGLFSNLNIETQRELVKDGAPASVIPTANEQKDTEVLKPEVVVFTVKATFGPSRVQQPAQSTAAPANQVAMKK